MSNSTSKVLYQPFSSILNPGFWQQLNIIKLNKLKLSVEPLDARGTYSCNLADTLPSLAHFDQASFSEDSNSSSLYSFPIFGKVTCTNTVDEFLDRDRIKQLLLSNGSDIWNSIFTGQALKNPEQYLSRFGLLVHADIKKYNFLYWFCFPALNYPKDVFYYKDDLDNNSDIPVRPILDHMDENTLTIFQKKFNETFKDSEIEKAYFIVKQIIRQDTKQSDVELFLLSQYAEAIRKEPNEHESTIYFAYADPSANLNYPGWTLRNYLCLIAIHFKISRVKLIRLRHGQPTSKSQVGIHHSLVFEVAYKLDAAYSSAKLLAGEQAIPPPPMVTGWEKDDSGELRPKRVNLSKLFDPRKLATDAVDLNLKLMKWRIVPNLDLDSIASKRCLILGCGTLGCHIARGLLAWGITNLTLVDNSVISYSNPVRQSLYTFQDCCAKPGSSAYKAEVAAESLKRIHPSINVSSHVMSIPMPGHHSNSNELDDVRKDVAKLERLINDHDVIFLLMDTRESRWLPSVIAISKQKLVINAAIGFDTFLLQRYGIRDFETTLDSYASHGQISQMLPSNRLGCYFCNDIVAPGNSTLDRTLDQQCTVSRPGVSMMVSALAVELLASVVSSSQGVMTPAPTSINHDTQCEEDLGIVPHSIRGNLSTYHMYMPTTPCFNKCSACSEPILEAYRVRGFEFLKDVFRDPKCLEELAGLKELLNEDDQIHHGVMVFDSDEDFTS